MEWNFIMPLMCISLLTRETEHLFYVFIGLLLYFCFCELHIYILCLFSYWMFVFFLTHFFRRSLYIQYSSLVSQNAMKIFFSRLGLFLPILYGIFYYTKVKFKVVEYISLPLQFVLFAFSLKNEIKQNSFLRWGHKNEFPSFSSRSFRILVFHIQNFNPPGSFCFVCFALGI